MLLKENNFFKRRSFPGGLFLKSDKWTRDKPIETIPDPDLVYIPFAQHTGIPSRPLVKKDQMVKVGTKIGERQGFISANVHSPISGRVIRINDHPHPVLGSSLTCVIENDHKGEWDQSLKKIDNWRESSPQDLLEIVTEAGITGQGGGSFPTQVKLSPPEDKKIDYLIINGCECEPMLTADYRVMVEFTQELIEGSLIIARILNVGNVVIVIEDNKRDLLPCFKEIIAGDTIKVEVFKSKYPQGSEILLIKTLLDRSIPSGGLPIDVGCIVHNVATVIAVYQAVKFGKPLIDRVITVTGHNIKEKKNIIVKFGTPALDIIKFCGGYIREPGKLIFGGPMMGIAQYTESVPVIKGTTGIIVTEEKVIFDQGPCVRCARCVDACPMALIPCAIADLVENKRLEQTKRYAIFDCIECGSCAYVCPTRRRLVHYIKFAKKELMRAKPVN